MYKFIRYTYKVSSISIYIVVFFNSKFFSSYVFAAQQAPIFTFLIFLFYIKIISNGKITRKRKYLIFILY